MGYATVSLIISGSSLQPNEVTTALGVQPTDAYHARDPARRRMLGDRAWNIGQWCLRREDVDFEKIAGVIHEFADLLQSGHVALGAAHAERQLMSIGLFELRGMGDVFYLDPQLMAQLASLGVVVMIDAYGHSSSDTGPEEV